MKSIDIYRENKWNYLTLDMDNFDVVITKEYSMSDYPNNVFITKEHAITIAKAILEYYGENNGLESI